MRSTGEERLCLLIVCVMFPLILGSCRPRERVPQLEQLLLEKNEIPGEWTTSPGGPQAGQGRGGSPLGGGFNAQESLVQYYYHPAGDGTAGAHERILRFGRSSDAEDSYEVLKDSVFVDGLEWTWEDPEHAIRGPAHAAESTLQCTRGRREQMCRLVARYDEYLVDLKIDLYGLTSQLEAVSVFTYEDLETVIQLVDQKMTMGTSEALR